MRTTLQRAIEKRWNDDQLDYSYDYGDCYDEYTFPSTEQAVRAMRLALDIINVKDYFERGDFRSIRLALPKIPEEYTDTESETAYVIIDFMR